MNIANIRTFLAVVETGSFVAAAARVHVTQSTVSMRIQALEERIGTPLFERNKSGAALTAQGREFSRHALAIARIWDQARQQVGVRSEQEALLRVGGQLSLWSGFLIDWLAGMRADAPEIALRCEVGDGDALGQHLLDGSLDLAILYRPQQRAGFRVSKLFDDDIVLVASPEAGDPRFGESYVYINWGPEFQKDHALNFPELSSPRVSLDLGVIGIDYLIRAKASGYFPRRSAWPYLQRGTLIEIPDAPSFSYPVYCIHPELLDEDLVRPVMSGLKETAAQLPRSGRNP